MQNKFKLTYFLPIIFVVLFTSCSVVRYVPDNEYLLSKVEINVDNNKVDRNELKSYLKQRPNTRIFGIWKFHLGLYNLSSDKKENGWLKRIGEAPVIYNPALVDRTNDELKRLLRNRGYYNAEIVDSVWFKRKKRAYVSYAIKANSPIRIDSYQAISKDPVVTPYVEQDVVRSTVAPNDLFDTDKLAAESQRVLRSLQNNGFYKANKTHIYFEADTTKNIGKVDLKMIVDNNTNTLSDSLYLHERYTFRNFYYQTDIEPQKNLFDNGQLGKSEPVRDTLQVGNHFIVYSDALKFKVQTLLNANHIADREYYSADLVDRTYNEFFALRLFKLINIRFTETGEVDIYGNPTLDCYIQLTPTLKQSYSVSAEGTNSLGNLGVAGNFGYQHKNLFKGGEIFDINLLGATEKQSYGKGDSARTFNSLELGADTKITFPKFIAPFKSQALFRFSTPQTFFNLAYNYQRRPDYTRSIIRGSYGYQWKSSEYTTHRINLFELNLVKMFALDSAFVSRIENLYIKSSYIDHSISALNYSYIFSNQNLQRKASYKYFRASIETAGNTMYGVSKLFNRPAYVTDSLSGKQYRFLGTPFAQYVKTDFEYRNGQIINRYNAFVFRAYAGIAVAMGNSVQMPFERKFFSGGANGIRAWPVRTLGPGSYKADPNEFPNQSGDIKLEANAEYRFTMIGPLEGAIFVDMGNIWSLKDNRPGTEFNISNFYKEIAVGSGFGLRYDFSYVIFRIDMGMKLRDPSLSGSNRWVKGSQLLSQDNLNFAFAIGYPF